MYGFNAHMKGMLEFMKNNKVDKGFELFYSKLSYRRKFIRTLWTTPFLVLSLVYMSLRNNGLIMSIIVGMTFSVLYFIQLTHTYSKWKKESDFNKL